MIEMTKKSDRGGNGTNRFLHTVSEFFYILLGIPYMPVVTIQSPRPARKYIGAYVGWTVVLVTLVTLLINGILEGY